MDKIQLLESVLGHGHKSNRDYYIFNCPFCNHRKPKLGISINSGAWKCWVCPSKGRNVTTLFKKLRQPTNVVESARHLWLERLENAKPDGDFILQLPPDYKPLWTADSWDFSFKKARAYLESRGVTIDDIKKHRIGYCSRGRYQNMIIMPSFDASGHLSFFTARGFCTKQFLVPGGVDKNDVIFDDNMIDWTEPIIIVESIFDAIAVKRNAIPLNGKQISKKLARKIIEERPPKVILCLDGDALPDMLILSKYFIQNGLEVYQVKLPPNEDPSSIGSSHIWDYISAAEKITELDLFIFNVNQKLK